MTSRLETNNNGQIAAAPTEVQWIAADSGGGDGQKSALRRFQMTAYTGGPMQLGGWRYPVVVDLSGLQATAKPKVFLEHDRTQRVGHIDQVQFSPTSLAVAGVISGTGKAAQEVLADAANGFPWQASIGARATEVEWVPEGQNAQANGQTFSGPINIARKSVLGEVSFVALGADDATWAQIAAKSSTHKEIPPMKETTPSQTPEPTVTPPTTPGKPETPAPVPAPITAAAPATGPVTLSPAEQIRAEAAAESLRIAAVRKVGGGRHVDIEAKAIAEGWDATRTELEILRADRPQAPGVIVRQADGMTGVVLEAACMLAAKAPNLEKRYNEPTLQVADSRFHSGIGLQELIMEAAWANGYTGRNFRDYQTVMRFAFTPDMCGGLSTVDISGILSNVANKFLLEGFFSVERTWRNLCAIRSVNDFKTVTSYRLIGTDQYEQVAPGGELKHGTLGNETYTNKADTYGLILAVDRRDLINDDLGAITTVPRKLGRGSGLKINDVFWTTFLANSAFFTAGNNNLLTGADTALGIDGLTKAEAAFMDQVDSDGKPIGIMPAIVLVPTGLSAMGTQLWRSLEIRDTTASTKYPIANPQQGKFRVEVSRFLGNARYTGNSTKAWYLLSDPADLPLIEVAFLNGNESPTIQNHRGRSISSRYTAPWIS